MRAFIICAVLRLTSQLAPQSLWRTGQQIASLDAHARTYESVIACTARDFLRTDVLKWEYALYAAVERDFRRQKQACKLP